MMTPMMKAVEDLATVIAPDTPGYGFSEPLPTRPQDLKPYVESFISLLDALNLEKAAVYGSATGAQIAVELGRTCPERISGVILDNAAAFSDAECEAITRGYFPVLKPRVDGSHLAAIWQLAHDQTLFFPWHQPSEENRIAAKPAPAGLIEATMIGYLLAGPDYHWAYRAAFANERLERVEEIPVPVVVIRWQGSILQRYTRRFDQIRPKPGMSMAWAGPTVEERLQCLRKVVPSLLPAQTGAKLTDSGQGFIRWRGRSIHFRPPAEQPEQNGSELPLLWLHPPGASSASLRLAGLCPAQDASLDLPGHGCSDPGEMLDIASCAEAVGAVAKALEWSAFGIMAVGAARPLGEYCRQHDRRVRKLLLSEPPPDCTLMEGPPADCDGAYLWPLWHGLRRALLSARPPSALAQNPDYLNRRLTDLLLARPHAVKLTRAWATHSPPQAMSS